MLLNTTSSGAAVASFADQVALGVGVNPYALAIGDLNGDGRPDLAVTNYRSDFLSVLLNTAPSGATALEFAAQQQVPNGQWLPPLDRDRGRKP